VYGSLHKNENIKLTTTDDRTKNGLGVEGSRKSVRSTAESVSLFLMGRKKIIVQISRRRTLASCSIRLPTTDCLISTHFAVFSSKKGKVCTLKARSDLYFTLTRIEYSQRSRWWWMGFVLYAVNTHRSLPWAICQSTTALLLYYWKLSAGRKSSKAKGYLWR
jgi:hypothetical protein